MHHGLNTKEFEFLGFLPLNKKNRKEKLQEIGKTTKTSILYEAPHKLQNTLVELQNYIQNRQVVLAKELTKIHETFIRGTIEQILQQEINQKGEFIICIAGNNKQETEQITANLSLEEQYEYYQKKGMEKKEIIKQIAKDNQVTKNEIYQQFINK